MRKTISTLIMLVAVVAGLAGAAFAYRAATPTGSATPATTVPAQVAAPETRVRWAPCADGRRLEKGVCVREVVRTVLVAAPAPAPVAVRRLAVVADDGEDGDDGDEAWDEDADDDGDDEDDDRDDHDEDDDDHDEDDDEDDEDDD